MDSLSADHRAVIILREVDGLSYSEIADAVGCTKGTVMSRLHHARRRLQKILAEFAPVRSSLDRQSGERVQRGAAVPDENAEVEREEEVANDYAREQH